MGVLNIAFKAAPISTVNVGAHVMGSLSISCRLPYRATNTASFSSVLVVPGLVIQLVQRLLNLVRSNPAGQTFFLFMITVESALRGDRLRRHRARLQTPWPVCHSSKRLNAEY